MAFSFRCLIAHSWDGCVCRRCNPEARVKLLGWRNRGHDLDGCFCNRCRGLVHDWDGCVCRRCEETRDQEHVRWGAGCSRCGAPVTGTREVACGLCGGTGRYYGPASGQGGDMCACVGGTVEETIWGAPVEPCLRPRRRPGLETQLATIRRDTSVAALARGIYDSGDFSGFFPLADALQEAGCTDEEVLNHCRRDRHARDCWVLRLLLGLPEPARP